MRPCSHHRTTQSQSHVPLTSVHTHTQASLPPQMHTWELEQCHAQHGTSFSSSDQTPMRELARAQRTDGGGGVKSVSYRRSLATQQQQQHHRHDSTSKSPHVVVMQGSILSPSPFYFFILLPCFPSGTNSRQATRLPGKM